MLKRLFTLALALLFFCLPTVLCVQAEEAVPPELNSKSAILYSLNTGEVLYEKNADERLSPASLTKIVTTMTVLMLCDDPDNTWITVPDVNLFEEITAVGGSNIELLPGETLSVTELLYAVMLPSACDACNVLAYHFGNGSIPAFVSKMNEWALSAGATDTNFQNAHGLDAPGHKSTARDISKMLFCALENERFSEIIRTDEFIIPENKLHAKRYINYQSTIPMLYSYNASYYKGLVGIKSGYTLEAKCCLSTMAEREEEKFLAVCMGAERIDGQNHARTDTVALYDWAFANFKTLTLKRAGEVIESVPLSGATSETAKLVLQEDLVLCTQGEAQDFSYNCQVESPLSPPFSEVPGTLQVLQNGKKVKSVDLYFETVPVAAELPEPPKEDVNTELVGGISPVIIVAIVVGILLVALAVCVFLLAAPPKKPAPRASAAQRPRPRGAPRTGATPPTNRRPPTNKR